MISENHFVEFRPTPYMDSLLADAAERRLPIQGELEITSRCNFSCVHCYVEPSERSHFSAIPFQVAVSIIDEASRAGCIWLLITGGEPLLHPRFKDIWKYAWDKGIRLSLFTNGSTIDTEIVEFFSKFPPESIEVSIYSLDPDTHAQITGSSKGFNRLMEGLALLKNSKFRTTIKTPVLTLNEHEIQAIQQFAIDNQFSFRMDAIIHPTLYQNEKPLTYRIAASRAAELAMSAPEIRAQLRSCFFDLQVPFNETDQTLPCSAGVYSFHVSSDAKLNVCSLMRKSFGDLETESFLTAWNRLVSYRHNPKEYASSCDSCSLRKMCVNCPGVAFINHSPMPFVDSYICEYTHSIAKLSGISFDAV